MAGDVMYLNQQKYIKELLDRYGLMNTKDVDTHMTFGKSLSKIDGTPLINASQYMSLVGGLQYYTLTQYDVSFAVDKLCQFMAQVSTMQLIALKKVLFQKDIVAHPCIFKSSISAFECLL